MHDDQTAVSTRAHDLSTSTPICKTRVWLLGERLSDEVSYIISDAQRNGCPIVYVSPGFLAISEFRADTCFNRVCGSLIGHSRMTDDDLKRLCQGAGLSIEVARSGMAFLHRELRKAVADVLQCTAKAVTILIVNKRRRGSLFTNLLTMCTFEVTRTPHDEQKPHRFAVGFQRDMTDVVSVASLLRAASDGTQCYLDLMACHASLIAQQETLICRDDVMAYLRGKVEWLKGGPQNISLGRVPSHAQDVESPCATLCSGDMPSQRVCYPWRQAVGWEPTTQLLIMDEVSVVTPGKSSTLTRSSSWSNPLN